MNLLEREHKTQPIHMNHEKIQYLEVFLIKKMKISVIEVAKH